ncbi:MAG: proteasome assembly chaperone family protein [Candidatus Baldrarchaeia archaeon]
MEIILKRNVELQGCIFLTGFHGIGETGFIAMNHIVESSNAELIGYVLTEQYPPLVFFEKNRVATPFELYMYRNLVIFLPRFQPPAFEQVSLIKHLAAWVVERGFEEALLIGGLDSRFRTEEPKQPLRVVPTSAYIRKKEIDMPTLEKDLFVAGPLALLLALFEINNFPAIALLPYAERNRPDPKAAAIAIQKINEIYGLDLPVQPLIEDAERIEKEIEELRRREEHVREAPSTMYV